MSAVVDVGSDLSGWAGRRGRCGERRGRGRVRDYKFPEPLQPREAPQDLHVGWHKESLEITQDLRREVHAIRALQIY